MSSVGTEYKINICMQPMGEIHLEDCEFTATFYVTATKSCVVEKVDMVAVDADNYIALVDSSLTGAGALKAKIAIDLPDGDFVDATRREVVTLDTQIIVEK